MTKTAKGAVGLTARQSRFVDEYLKDLDAAEAAEQSGEFCSDAPREGYYVYLLVNPVTDRVFYVGKGVRGRASQHAREARAGKITNVRKHRAIIEVHSAGHEVQILYRPMPSEAEALRFERHLIFSLKDHGITNQVSGSTPLAERVRAEAQYNLDRMKSRDEWKLHLDEDTLARVVRVFGSLDACYDRILNGFTKLANDPDGNGEWVEVGSSRDAGGCHG